MIGAADRIEKRNRHALAWAICDMVQTAAAMNEEPAAPVRAILNAIQDRASPPLRRAIASHGLQVFRLNLLERAELAELLQSCADRQAAAWLDALAAMQSSRNGGRAGARGVGATHLPRSLAHACTGFLGRFLRVTPARP